ncbi:MAG: protocatechuate 3,4-dioxygenase subunit alpha [Pseudomonadota bacterium]
MATTSEPLPQTASQTAGPFVHIGLLPAAAGLPRRGAEAAPPDLIVGEGLRIRVGGRMFDGAGEVVRDAVLELWQADATGRYVQPGEPRRADGFQGFARTATGFDDGCWWFDTLKPGPVQLPGGEHMAPHLTLWIMARGLNVGLHTRVYFGDETTANAADPVLQRIDPPARRETLITRVDTSATQVMHHFDIRLQGTAETVFFDV